MLLNILLFLLFLCGTLVLGVWSGIVLDNEMVTIVILTCFYATPTIQLFKIIARRETMEKAVNILDKKGRGDEILIWLQKAGAYQPASSGGLEEYRPCVVNLQALSGCRFYLPYEIKDKSLAMLINSMCHLEEEAVIQTARQLISLYKNKERLDKFFNSMGTGRHGETTENLKNAVSQLLTIEDEDVEHALDTLTLEKAFSKKTSSREQL